jgi:hypothetical protein
MVGYRPRPGAFVYWVFPGGRPTGVTTRFTDTGNEFPWSIAAYDARYGVAPTLPGSPEVRANSPVYAEAIGLLNVAMQRASQDPYNPWGFVPGVPTELEVQDFAHCECSSGWASSPIKRLYFDQQTPVIVPPPPPPPPPVDPGPPPVDPSDPGPEDPGTTLTVVTRETLPVAVPEDIRQTLDWAPEWTLIGAGRRARLTRLRQWVDGLERTTVVTTETTEG